MNPVHWAQQAVKEHGWTHALSVSNAYNTPRLGKDGDAPNPFYAFWNNAYTWIVKRAPKGAIEDHARHLQALMDAKAAMK